MPQSLKCYLLTEEDHLDVPEMEIEPISSDEELEEDSSSNSSFHFSFPSTSSPSVSSLSSFSMMADPLEEEEAEEMPSASMMSSLPSLPQSFPSSCSSSTSWRKLEEDFFSQEDEDTAPLIKDGLDKKVAEIVQFFLLKYQAKELISEAEMLGIVTEYKGHFPMLLGKAREFTELVFGIFVRELGPNNYTYMSYDTIDITFHGMLGCDQTAPKTSLLLIVLGMIFIEGDCMPEEKVWEVLNALDVYAEKEHFLYGDPRMLITNDWVQQGYLVYQQLPDSDPKCYEFQWGPRAHAEVSEEKILELLAKLKDTILSSFPAWYKDGLKNVGKPRM